MLALVASAEQEDEEEEWALCFLCTLSSVEEAAASLFPGNPRHAQQAADVLGRLVEALYRVRMEPVELLMPTSLTVSTTSKRLRHWGQEDLQAVELGYGGSAACSAKLALAGLTPHYLDAEPRRILEVHLADVAKALVLVLPYERGLLVSDREFGPIRAHVRPADAPPPVGSRCGGGLEALAFCAPPHP